MENMSKIELFKNNDITLIMLFLARVFHKTQIQIYRLLLRLKISPAWSGGLYSFQQNIKRNVRLEIYLNLTNCYV